MRSHGGNNDSPDRRKPQDNYNGITVAGSMRMPDESVYRKFWAGNAMIGWVDGARPSIDILAPGENVRVLGWGDQVQTLEGSSLTAPHVAGAIAILHEYATQNPFTGPNRHRHEVMKAVILNSADKHAGVHGSTRDVIDSTNARWPDQNSLSFPLHQELGAGHLNVQRAVQQLAAGQYAPGPIPLKGWDYRTIGGAGDVNEYVFSQPLGGGYIAITLVWDRIVQHTETCGANNYCEGDTFFTNQPHQTLNNLDLYLLPKDETNIGFPGAVWGSISGESNVEHVWFNVDPGEYKIAVRHSAGGIGSSQNYGIAWWFGDPSSTAPGDLNGDGNVDTADYVWWRKNNGTPEQYDEWRENFGSTSGAGSESSWEDFEPFVPPAKKPPHLAAVPEPSSMILLIGCALVGSIRLRIR